LIQRERQTETIVGIARREQDVRYNVDEREKEKEREGERV